jgi:hypothetical protein
MKASDAKRLKGLEVENVRLKKHMAEAELDKAMLKGLAEENVPHLPSTRASRLDATFHRELSSPNLHGLLQHQYNGWALGLALERPHVPTTVHTGQWVNVPYEGPAHALRMGALAPRGPSRGHNEE